MAFAYCEGFTVPALPNGGTWSTGLSGTSAQDASGQATASCSGNTLSVNAWCSWNCFLGDTYITMADGAQKQVRDLKPGDRVKGQTRINTVLHVPNYDTHQALYSFNGEKAFVTAGHPFMTTDGWKAIDPDMTPEESHNILVGKLEIGDSLITEDGSAYVIESIDKADMGTMRVYNPMLNGDHTYYVNGKLVHNK
jgi:hypothetical protein